MDFQRYLIPAYWYQNYPTIMEWDKKLNDLIDAGAPISNASVYSIKLGDVRIWTGNWPYAYGHPYGTPVDEMLATVRTRKRLRSYIIQQYFK